MIACRANRKAWTAVPAVLSLLAACANEPVPAVSGESLSLADSVGVEWGDSLYMFGDIIALEFLPDGSFAVLDRIAGNIRVFSPSGDLLRVISSPGSGPGQIVQAFGMLVFPNGDLGVMDPNQGGLMRFSPSGAYLGLEFEAYHNIPMGMVMVGDSGYAGSRTAIDDHGGDVTIESFIGYFPLTWEPGHKYLSRSTPLDMATLSSFLMETMLQCPWTVDPVTGTVYAAPYSAGEFLIQVLPLSDTLQVSAIALDLPVVEKTPEEIREERDLYASLFTVMEGGDPQYDVHCEPFPFRHPVSSMAVDDSGRLWVLRGDVDEPEFFVFDPTGELVFRFFLPGVPHSLQLVFRVRGDRMLLYAENPSDYQRIWIVEIPSF